MTNSTRSNLQVSFHLVSPSPWSKLKKKPYLRKSFFILPNPPLLKKINSFSTTSYKKAIVGSTPTIIATAGTLGPIIACFSFTLATGVFLAFHHHYEMIIESIVTAQHFIDSVLDIADSMQDNLHYYNGTELMFLYNWFQTIINLIPDIQTNLYSLLQYRGISAENIQAINNTILMLDSLNGPTRAIFRIIEFKMGIPIQNTTIIPESYESVYDQYIQFSTNSNTNIN